MARKRAPINTGDVYAVQVPDGRFAAVRVLQSIDRSQLVYASDYLGISPPDLNDISLRRCLIQNRFSYRNSPAMWWLGGRIPGGLVRLGNIPVTEAESAMTCSSFAYWDLPLAHSAYLEWRWIHDRPALEQEVATRQAEQAAERTRRALAQKPKKMLSEDDFWAIIDRLDWSRTGDDERVVAPAVQALSALGKKQIQAFEERLSHCLYLLDTREHARHLGAGPAAGPGEYVSADGFLYARCAAVANGKAVYEAARHDPSLMPREVEFEALLDLANAAHVARYGDDLDYETGCNRESFSNAEGWRAR